jgi:peptidoglycan/xylan/chitin deacetylase (PgdA/CDA1 family)
VLTVRELAERLRSRRLPARAVAISFDDGYASVAREALPLLERRGLAATVFCVARRLGQASEWPSRAAWAPVLPLASAQELARLAAAGWEVGSHGLEHEPGDAGFAESRELLEARVGVEVTSFAYPYGVVPPDARSALADAGYAAACTTRLARVDETTDPYELPRVDMHYLRSARLLHAVLAGRLDGYLRARSLGARARRLALRDHR